MQSARVGIDGLSQFKKVFQSARSLRWDKLHLLLAATSALVAATPGNAHAFVRFYNFNGTNAAAQNYGDGAGSTSDACSGFVPENGTSGLTCAAGAGGIEAIAFANYGTPSGACGSYSLATSCNPSSNAAQIVSSCVGYAGCTVPASNGFFGDPCPGTVKQLAVQATCAPDTGEQTAGLSSASGRASGGATALDFSSGTSVSVDDGSVSGNTARTIAFWIKGAAADETVFSSGSQASSYFSIVIDSSLKPAIQGSSGLSLASSVALDTNTWTHVLASYDPTGSTSIYVNGELRGSATTSSLMGSSTLSTPSTFRIGASDTAADFTGQIDDLYIADQASLHALGAVAIMNLKGTDYTTLRGGGVPAPLTAAQIPTLSEWGMMVMLAGLILTMTLRTGRAGQA